MIYETKAARRNFSRVFFNLIESYAVTDIAYCKPVKTQCDGHLYINYSPLKKTRFKTLNNVSTINNSLK